MQHTLFLATDACFHCIWLKHKVPGKIINCTGIHKLCSFKYELFNAWPPKFYKEAYLMTKILMSDTLKIFADLLDEIFNVKFIKRAMQLKAMVDCQIMAIHPHMAEIIAFYDLLIYRYYSSVWNRNVEGKLQPPEEKEKEGEEEEKDGGGGDDDDDDDNGKEKKGRDELDTVGLERGEGIEIVVLKVVPTKKKKKKKKKKKEE